MDLRKKVWRTVRNEKHGGGGGEGSVAKTQLWEKSKISKIKRHSFKHINPVKLVYIMLNPPQFSGALAISTEAHVCYRTPTHSGQGYIPAFYGQCTFRQFKHGRLNKVHSSPWNRVTAATR